MIWTTIRQPHDVQAVGRLTDAQGRTVSFKNTIVVMTSNIGAREITGKSSLGFARSDENEEKRREENIRTRVMEAVKVTFRPEFINRLDEIIVFHPLNAAFSASRTRWRVQTPVSGNEGSKKPECHI